jgi:hypothetical protein
MHRALFASTRRAVETIIAADEAASKILEKQFHTEFESTLAAVNRTPRDSSGVWYYMDYDHYLDQNSLRIHNKYQNGYVDTEYWKMTGPYVFEVKRNVLPSVALNAFLSGFTVTDCGSVIVACQYAALLKVLGEDKFNLLFSAAETPLKITRFIFDLTNPVSYFFSRSNNTPVRGDMCYMEGVKYYHVKHPRGHARGWSLFCSGENELSQQSYFGFGPNDFKQPLTEETLQSIFRYYYNLPRDRFNLAWLATQNNPEEFDLKSQNQPAEISVEEAKAVIPGYESNSTISADFSKIIRYVTTAITAKGFRKDYDDFLISNGELPTSSKPSYSRIELPGLYRPIRQVTIESEEAESEVRCGIPLLCRPN